MNVIRTCQVVSVIGLLGWSMWQWPDSPEGIAAGKRVAFDATVEEVCENLKLGADTGSERIMARDICEGLRKESRRR